MRLCAFVCGLFLSTIVLGQTKPEFSGVFLRTSIDSPDQSPFRVLDPLVLEIKESADTLRFTTMQNGAAATTTYKIDGTKSTNVNRWGQQSVDRLKFKSQKLVTEGLLTGPPGMPMIATGRRVKEEWELSPDHDTLTVRRRFESQRGSMLDVIEKEKYERKASLSAALQEASAASGTSKCNNLPLLGLDRKTAEYSRKYDEGALVGHTVFQRLDQCVLFIADLSSPYFKGLERINKLGQVEFHKNGNPTSDYPDSVVLEIQPHVHQCSPWLDGYEYEAEVVPPEFLNLRFQLKWLGSKTQELGEIEAELRTEPWPELRPPERFYRLQVPTKNLRLTDTLEIHILSPSGKQLACITGHL